MTPLGWVATLGCLAFGPFSAYALADRQIILTSMGEDNGGWKVSVSQDWDVLGPFPIHAREQHFISPSFPLDLTQPIDWKATWPSSYADNGTVHWTTARSQDDGTLVVAHPEIRWQSLRATEGWAALQHHNVLRTSITVHPPTEHHDAVAGVPNLRVDFQQASYFAVVPPEDAQTEGKRVAPTWHAGNIYELGQSLPNVVPLPYPPSNTSPTKYDLFVSGDYEIRLFGDPHQGGSEIPKLSLTFSVSVEAPAHAIVRRPSHDVFCDFVDGWAFGDALGVGLQSDSGWWSVNGVIVPESLGPVMTLELAHSIRLAPTQARIVPLRILQTQPFHGDKLQFNLTVVSGDTFKHVAVSLVPTHRAQWTDGDARTGGIKATHFFAYSMPTAFIVKPPLQPNKGSPRPPILALHGAGVDIFAEDFWIQAIPQQQHSWVVAPAGRTAWGLDWHGPSAQDAWSTVDALYTILQTRREWRSWGLSRDTKVLLLGHSNGGQGAWYLAGRYPDRIVGVIPAAGYIKSQAYVPWTMSKSAHYVDPAVRAILDSSLTPDDNDLFLSNLVHTPILAVHGGDDENVPVWHTREAVSVLKAWDTHANVTYREDPGQPHWYDTVFDNDEVRSFATSVLEHGAPAQDNFSRPFTLTVASPADSGSLHGWSILKLLVPGRLGRLTFWISGDGTLWLRASNVQTFNIPLDVQREGAVQRSLVVNGQKIAVGGPGLARNVTAATVNYDAGRWVVTATSKNRATAPRTGRLLNILTTPDPLTIVIPTLDPSPELSAALRLAHNLDVYHKLDADIHAAAEVQRLWDQGALGPGNLIVIGVENNPLAQAMLKEGRTPFAYADGALSLRGRSFARPSDAVLFLHPHPDPQEPASLALIVHGGSAEALERALRLVPLRTGVTVPDWIIIGPRADAQGLGGVEGVGVWGNDWSWNDAMSAF